MYVQYLKSEKELKILKGLPNQICRLNLKYKKIIKTPNPSCFLPQKWKKLKICMKTT
jgi:hypothetical protein